MPASRRLAAILAADVAGYSRLMGVDEEGTLARLKTLRRDLLDPKIAEHKGRIVKTTGDGMLVEFASVVDAVRCAVAVQRQARRCSERTACSTPAGWRRLRGAAHRPVRVERCSWILLASIFQRVGQLVPYLVAHRPGDADPAGLRERFEARGNIDAVAEIDPMRHRMRRSSGTSGSRSSIPRCTSAAQRTASTTLANSASSPSPVVSTMRPGCSAIFGSINSARNALSRPSVPSSSASITRA